jgi:uncharacterized protein YbjT (DUF2867 family)
MSEQSSLVILGPRSPIGGYLLRRLALAGMLGTVVSRQAIKVPDGFVSVVVDLDKKSTWEAEKGATVISLLPLWELQKFLPRLTQALYIIATGSTSQFSKSASSDPHERSISEKLSKAEVALQQWAEDNGVIWTILRSTLIYDCKSDKNITRMAQFIKRWRVLPLGAPASGLRQPIHCDDAAKAIFQSIDNPAVVNKAYNIAGGEILSYREMAERVFQALGRKPRFLMLPVPLLEKLFKIAVRVGLVKESSFGAAVFQRMNEDLIFDTEEGVAILDYEPRPFKPKFL